MTSPDTISPAPRYEAEFIPGTVQLVDNEGKLDVHHADNIKQHDVVLIPTPSDSPDDPLNWSPLRKNTQLFCICV